MDPKLLIGPPSPLGYPAPYWFLVAFKVLGFTLHALPMNLWYAGIFLAVLFRWRGGEGAARFSGRLMSQMPVIVAFGINLGIVPLLFLQVAYYRVFYPATILMAWPWLGIVGLLMLAYYGVYLYAIGLRQGRLTTFRKAVGWISALLFLAMGFVFSNAMSLMSNVGAWPGIWQKTGIAGAPLGIGLNTGDPTLWPRWLMMFGLALMTTGVYVAIDAAFFAGGEDSDYRRQAPGLALKVCSAGLLWFAVMGLWYVFGAWPADLRASMLDGSMRILTALTALAPGLPWLLLLFQRAGVTRPMALAAGFAQFGVLGLNAVTRQVVQNAQLSPYLDVTAEAVNTQWSPLILFLATFAVGVAILVWMVRRAIAAGRQPAAASG